jgi:hypothetical protein
MVSSPIVLKGMFKRRYLPMHGRRFLAETNRACLYSRRAAFGGPALSRETDRVEKSSGCGSPVDGNGGKATDHRPARQLYDSSAAVAHKIESLAAEAIGVETQAESHGERKSRVGGTSPPLAALVR